MVAPAASPKWGHYCWFKWTEIRLKGHNLSNARDIPPLCSLPIFTGKVERNHVFDREIKCVGVMVHPLTV